MQKRILATLLALLIILLVTTSVFAGENKRADGAQPTSTTLTATKNGDPSTPAPALRLITNPDDPPTGYTCETTNAPATNEQGVNGANSCTTCTFNNGHVSVTCVFRKPPPNGITNP